MKKKLLLFITPYKFRHFDWSRFEFSYLEKKFNTKIIIHELIDFIYPHFKKVYLNTMKSKKVYSFKNFNQWKKAIHKLLNKNNKIILFTSLKCENLISFLILKELKKYNVSYFNFGSDQNPELRKQVSGEFLKKLKRAIFRPKKIIHFLNQKIFHFLGKIYKLHPTYSIQAGSRGFMYNKKQTKAIKGNSYDYSNFLIESCKNKKKKKRDCIIFLEAPGPKFKGDSAMTFDDESDFCTKENWYPSLVKFFDVIEKVTKLKVKIAPHPKVKHKKFPKYYGGREVLNEKLSKSSFRAKVIISRSSTGFSYAVAHKIPSIMIYSNEISMNKIFFNDKIKHFARELGVTPINIDAKLKSNNIKKLLKINYQSYKNYKSRYLTSRFDSKYNHEIIQDLMNAEHK